MGRLSQWEKLEFSGENRAFRLFLSLNEKIDLENDFQYRLGFDRLIFTSYKRYWASRNIIFHGFLTPTHSEAKIAAKSRFSPEKCYFSPSRATSHRIFCIRHRVTSHERPLPSSCWDLKHSYLYDMTIRPYIARFGCRPQPFLLEELCTFMIKIVFQRRSKVST